MTTALQLLTNQFVFGLLFFFLGELHTYEALSSDMQKNVLSSLRRLGAVTKIEMWVNEIRPWKSVLFNLNSLYLVVQILRYYNSYSRFYSCLIADLRIMNIKWTNQLWEELETCLVSVVKASPPPRSHQHPDIFWVFFFFFLAAAGRIPPQIVQAAPDPRL